MKDSSLSQDEIEALLAGVDMGSGKDVVVTAYGHEKIIDRIAISNFEGVSGRYGNRGNAETYCKMINALKLEGDSWVFAKIVPENTPFDLYSVVPGRLFSDLILNMDDRAVQKVLREVDTQEVAKAIKGTSEAVLEKIFRNMSKRAGGMLREDMEYMGPIRKQDALESQHKITSIIKHLEETGEIILTRSGEDFVV